MITKLIVSDYDIPNRQQMRGNHNNPIKSALYRGVYSARGVEQKEGHYQGKVKFDVPRQCYWIWTGEYARPPVKAGELLHAWLSAWYHGKDVFPITLNFTEDTAEVEGRDRDKFLSFWKGKHVTENTHRGI